LVEDCAAWGWGRYSFMADGQSWEDLYVVFRRCVARNDNLGNDMSEDGRQTACFGSYQEEHVYFQNCIAIDGIETTDPYSTMIWMTPNGANNVKWQDCIQVNNQGCLWYIEGAGVPYNIRAENCLFLGCRQSVIGGRAIGLNSVITDAMIVSNCSFFDLDDYTGIYKGREGSQEAMHFERCIFYLDTLSTTEDLNVLLSQCSSDSTVIFDNYLPDGNFNSYAESHATNVFDNAPASMNPALSYEYPVIRKTGTSLDDNKLGHHIFYKRGVSGTLYGEPGWDTLTDEELWPWPYEGVIKSKMAAYNRHGMNGARGFCAGNGSLTDYIMNWFGNGNPFEKPAPATPKGIKIESQ